MHELPPRMRDVESVNLCAKLPHHLWHCRLGHLNSSYMSMLINQGLIKSNSKIFDLCHSCQHGISHALPHPSRKISYKPLALIFLDIWGPAPAQSIEGYSYYANFVYAANNCNWVYPMVRKSDIYHIFDKFRSWVERQCGVKILAVQTDNA